MTDAIIAAIIAGMVYMAGLGIWHGIKKVGHGAKVVACKVVHCEQNEDKK